MRHVLPEGTSLTVWTRHGAGISDELGQFIETGRSIDFSQFGDEIIGARSYLPGSVVPDYTLFPPGNELNILGNPTTVSRPTSLSNLLSPNQGNVNWAACLEWGTRKGSVHAF